MLLPATSEGFVQHPGTARKRRRITIVRKKFFKVQQQKKINNKKRLHLSPEAIFSTMTKVEIQSKLNYRIVKPSLIKPYLSAH